ncbi:MAG: LuxR C-terminal-related transcriptional regulator [Chloroflexota bacterium]
MVHLPKKFCPPFISSKIINRPRLFARLDEAIACRLVLLSAPAGFGKSTLLASWLVNSKAPFAWLNLSEEEDSPEKLCTALVQAVQQSTIQTTFPQPAEDSAFELSDLPVMLQPLIEILTQISTPIRLIIDDAHRLDARLAPELERLIEHLPAHVQLILSTRSDPPISLARLRASGQLLEIRVQDLRFEPDEVRAVVECWISSVLLSAEQIELLTRRTEGWIAGVQMAALSLRNQDNPEAFIQHFSGTNRFILDYLIEEVLSQIPERLKVFLLYTSILEQMCEPLCQALLAEEEKFSLTGTRYHSVLEELYRSNFFVLPMDDAGRWYRYHPLFSDLLRQRLSQCGPTLELNLHRAASRWFAEAAAAGESELLPLAIEHSIAAKDFSTATSLLSEALESLWGRDELGRLSRLLLSIPTDHLRQSPELMIGMAASLLTAGKLAEAEYILQQTDLKSPRTTLGKPFYAGRVAVLLAYIAAFRGETELMIEQAKEGLIALANDPQAVWRSSAHILLGDSFAFQDDLFRAAQSYRAAEEEARCSKNQFFVLFAQTKLLIILLRQGRLNQVAERCHVLLEHLQEIQQERSPRAGVLHALLSEVHLAQNALEDALFHARYGYELGRFESNIAIASFTRMTMAKVYFANGDFGGLQKMLRELLRIESQNELPIWTRNDLASLRFHLALSQNHLTEAREQLDMLCDCLPRDSSQEEFLISLLRARLALAEGQPAVSIDLINSFQDKLNRFGRLGLRIEAMILQTQACVAMGQTDLAAKSLCGALELAMEENFLRIFVEADPPLAMLLSAILKGGEVLNPKIHSFARRVLLALPGSIQTGVSGDNPEMVEPLSERELEILALIAAGLTNKEIGSRLYLTERTVKWHASNLYRKMGVENRTAALKRARALKLLKD